MTTTLTVKAAHHEYPVVIEAGLRHRVGTWLKELGVKETEHVFLLTDETVAAQGYAEDVQHAVEAAGYSVSSAAVAPGDSSKSLAVVEQLYNTMLDAGLRRSSVLLAVGGGVIGDLGGFVAATYQRGIRFVQIPTTLLAHDSSIGGKVGVNLPRGKNLVGAFHPPIGVLYDVETLSSLPTNEWQAGMAEVIKHAIIGDAILFEELENAPMPACQTKGIDHMLARAVSVKIALIEADEREQGPRMLLNLGHTVGHALEQYSQYKLSHGAAVSIGMAVEGMISVDRGLLTAANWERMTRLLQAHGLPTKPPEYPFAELAQIMNLDKKHSSAAYWTCALPESIGCVRVHRDVTEAETRQAFYHTTKELSS